MVDINPSRSIITVNVNKQIKSQTLSERILEKYSTTHYIQEIHFKYIKAHVDLKIRKGWRKIFHMNTN